MTTLNENGGLLLCDRPVPMYNSEKKATVNENEW
jgi:hypothetical protein